MSEISKMPQLWGNKIGFVFRRSCFIFQLWLISYQLLVVKSFQNMNYFKTDNLKRDKDTRLCSSDFCLTDLVKFLNSRRRCSHFSAAGQGLWESVPNCSWEHLKEGGPWCEFGAHEAEQGPIQWVPLSLAAQEEGFGWLCTANIYDLLIRGAFASPAPYMKAHTMKTLPPNLNILPGQVMKCKH